jgi:hypothetical protein
MYKAACYYWQFALPITFSSLDVDSDRVSNVAARLENEIITCFGCEVLVAVTVKSTVFWVVMPCSSDGT